MNEVVSITKAKIAEALHDILAPSCPANINHYLRQYNKLIKGAVQDKEQLHDYDPDTVLHHSDNCPEWQYVVNCKRRVLTDAPAYRFGPPKNAAGIFHWSCYDVRTFLAVACPDEGLNPNTYYNFMEQFCDEDEDDEDGEA